MSDQRCVSHPSPWYLPFVVLAAACGDDGGIPDDPFKDTDSTTGDLSGTGGAESGQADETGGGGLVPVEEQCLYDSNGMDDVYGYRYQCGGRVWLDITIEHGLASSPDQELFKLEFGDGVDGDSYQEPYVLACCPWYDASEPNCGQPHERACWVDLVEQGCKSMIGKLEAFAYAQYPGLLQTAERLAVLKIADYVRDNQEECTTAFRQDTGIAAMQPSCDEDGNGVPYTSMLEDGVWTFEPDGPIHKVEIAVAQADWHGLYPIAEPLATGICFSADDNDDVLFLEVDPAPGSKVTHLVAGNIELVGPGVGGIGELSSTSTLALLREGEAGSLESLTLEAAGPAAVLTDEATIPVDDFHVRLWDRATAFVDGATLTVPPDSARFAVGASGLGHSRVDTATNTTPIVITSEGQGWRISAFAIEARHRDEPWSLVVAPSRWQ